jgi:nicotinate-nucleotide pyrophosphorylase (carboxylating)
MWSDRTIQLIHAAFDEDLGNTGDATVRLLADAAVEVDARVVARADGVICGLALGPHVCGVFADRSGQALRFESAARAEGRCSDGQAVCRDEVVATLIGPKAAVLSVERTLLNFLSRVSGVATLTRHYVEGARKANPRVQILDTRKTIPGWRELDKYAVRCGGGHNHRMGLYDAVLIKDNHLAGVPTEHLARTLTEMLHRVPGRGAATESERRRVSERHQAQPGARAAGTPSSSERPPRLGSGLGAGAAPAFVEVEVDNLAQLAEVCKTPGIDVVLLDNFALDELREAVAYRDSQGLRDKLALEASGKVTLENIADIAATGVDRISVGALTHSAASLDVGLDF